VNPEQSIAAFNALAHEHRLAAYRQLVEAGPPGRTAGALAEQLAIPPSSLSFHLQLLLRAGLVTQRRTGRQLIYAANFTTMNALVAYLTQNCCAGQSEGSCTAPANEACCAE
jgi:ArsR family transcriptional regulator, arsenate/arsenite/antimonite-responsive transcriptional repressor